MMLPKPTLKTLAGLAVLLGLVSTSCKKKEEPEPEPVPIAQENGQASKDNRDVQSENDISLGDINQVLSDNNKTSGRPAESGMAARPVSICGLSVDTTGASMGMLTLNYTGVTCDNRTRTGSIKLTLQSYTAGVRWKDQGAVVQVDFNNYKVTRASDQASIKLNGTQFYTNVSGGNWLTFLVLQQPSALVTSVTGTNLTVTFQDNSTAVYNINRKITYTLSGTVLTVKGEGIGSNGSLSNLENYGTTRDGDAFTSQVSTPIVWNTTCGAGAPLQGFVEVKVPSKNLTLACTYGVDINGNVVAVPANSCAYGWKYLWTVNTTSASNIVKYN